MYLYMYMVAMKSYMYRWLYMCVSNRDVYNWAQFIIIRIIDARTGLDEQLACLVRSKPKHLYIFCTFHTRFESLWGCSATVALWCGFAWQVTSDQDIQTVLSIQPPHGPDQLPSGEQCIRSLWSSLQKWMHPTQHWEKFPLHPWAWIPN